MEYTKPEQEDLIRRRFALSAMLAQYESVHAPKEYVIVMRRNLLELCEKLENACSEATYDACEESYMEKYESERDRTEWITFRYGIPEKEQTMTIPSELLKYAESNFDALHITYTVKPASKQEIIDACHAMYGTDAE